MDMCDGKSNGLLPPPSAASAPTNTLDHSISSADAAAATKVPPSGQTDGPAKALLGEDPFAGDAAIQFPASKGEPTNFSTPTGIHPLTSYPDIHSALGEGDIHGRDGANAEVAKNLVSTFELPKAEPSQAETETGRVPAFGDNQDVAAIIQPLPLNGGAAGPIPAPPSVSRCASEGDLVNAGSPQNSDKGATLPTLAQTLNNSSTRDANDSSPSEPDRAALTDTGMTVTSNPFLVLNDGHLLPTSATTGHISHDPDATQAMIAQGTSLSNAADIADTDALLLTDKQNSHYSEGSRSDDDDQGEPIHTGRVDASGMEVLENPLSKSDRYTVIKGRLPDTDPFMKASKSLGKVFMSAELKRLMPHYSSVNVSNEDREANFMKDVEAFNKELNREFKIPIIGGGQLSLYALAMEVMKLGGLKNVVLNRAFRIVGQQLELPKSCTSAAFVLKNAYERLLYQYEQKLAFGINPSHPQRTIDMKELVSETRKQGSDRRNRSRKQGAIVGTRLPGPGQAFPGRVSKRRRSGLDSITAKQMEAVRHAAEKELRFADPGGATIRRSAEECPDLVAGISPMHTEKLANQQPDSGSAVVVGNFLPDGIIPVQEWISATTPALDILGHGQSQRNEGLKQPPTSGTLNAAALGRRGQGKAITKEQMVFTVFGGDDSVQALEMAAKILHALRGHDSRLVRLGDMTNGAGATLLSSIVQVFHNYLKALRIGSDGGWRAVVARCAGEILRILLLVQDNQVFCSMTTRLWRVSIDILSADSAEEPIVSSLWTAVSIMAPYLPVTVDAESLMELLQLASEHLGKSPGSAQQVAWFISGSVRGLTSKMGDEYNGMVSKFFNSLTSYVAGGSAPLQHATLTALLHLSRVYPEMAGGTRNLVYILINQLTAKTTGGLSASTLYYICQASPATLTGFEDLLVAQTRRVVSAKGGAQNSDQIIAILSLLTGDTTV